jgi:hypothetical protein
MDPQVSALEYNITSVGRHIRATKKKHSWRFLIHGNSHQIDVYASAISGKKRVVLDGDMKFEGKSPPGKFFQYLDYVEEVMIRVEQTEIRWDLIVGGVSFEERLERGPRIGEFRSSEGEDSADLWPNPHRKEAMRSSFNGPMRPKEEPIYLKFDPNPHQIAEKIRYSSAPRGTNPRPDPQEQGYSPKPPASRDLRRPAVPSNPSFRPVPADTFDLFEGPAQTRSSMPAVDVHFPQTSTNYRPFQTYTAALEPVNQPIRARPLHNGRKGAPPSYF